MNKEKLLKTIKEMFKDGYSLNYIMKGYSVSRQFILDNLNLEWEGNRWYLDGEPCPESYKWSKTHKIFQY